MTQEEKEMDPEYCLRKANQAWDLAGCARIDGDTKDEKRWTDEARRLLAKRKELL